MAGNTMVSLDPSALSAFAASLTNLPREEIGKAVCRNRLFAEAPGDPETRAALERLAVGAGLVEELVAAYEDSLEKGVGAELALVLWRRIAQIRSERLDERDRRIEEQPAPGSLGWTGQACFQRRTARF